MLDTKVLIVSLLVTAVPATGFAAQDYLPPSQAARMLADGQPWNAELPDGKKARLTFNADGTGSFEGPITISTSWAIKGDNLCVNLRIAGTRCLRFRQVTGGFQAYQGEAADLRLTR